MVYTEFQKIGDFKSQQLEMTYKQIIYHSKGIDESYPKMYFLSNLSYCQKFWAFLSKFWHFLQCPLTKYGHVTWPKKQISKFFYFFPILHLLLRKVTKFLMRKLCTSKVVSRKHTPCAFRVKILLTWNCRHITSWAKVGPMQAIKVQVFLPHWFCMGKIIRKLVAI